MGTVNSLTPVAVQLCPPHLASFGKPLGVEIVAIHLRQHLDLCANMATLMKAARNRLLFVLTVRCCYKSGSSNSAFYIRELSDKLRKWWDALGPHVLNPDIGEGDRGCLIDTGLTAF